MGLSAPKVTRNWVCAVELADGTAGSEFLTARPGGAGAGRAEGAAGCAVRVALAMEALGPGLSDIVFRIRCFTEGLETAEKRLGWSAWSGKGRAEDRAGAAGRTTSCCPPGSGGSAELSSAGGGDDRAEILGLGAGAAHQCPIDIADREDLGRIAEA